MCSTVRTKGFAFLLSVFGAYYAVSALLFVACGYTITLPWPTLTLVAGISVPLAYALFMLGQGLARFPPHMSYVLGFLTGVLLVVISDRMPSPAVVIIGSAGALVWRLFVRPDRFARNLGFAMTAVVLWLAATLHINYAVLRNAGHRLTDAVFQHWDNRLYHGLGIGLGDPRFPLVTVEWQFRILENAYVTLGMQIVFTVMVLATFASRLQRYLWSALFAYVGAATIFLLVPVIGPTLMYPSSFSSAFASTITGTAIEAMRIDAESIRAGGQPITGYGYFIAFPSMHAAMAVVIQLALRSSMVHFWMMLPVNVLLLISTVALGQHYLVDPVAGIASGACCWYLAGKVAPDCCGVARPQTARNRSGNDIGPPQRSDAT